MDYGRIMAVRIGLMQIEDVQAAFNTIGCSKESFMAFYAQWKEQADIKAALGDSVLLSPYDV